MADDLKTTAADAMSNLDLALMSLEEAKESVVGRIDQVESLMAQLSQCIVAQNANTVEQAKTIGRINEANLALIAKINKLDGRLVILENASRTNLFTPPIN